MYKQPKIQTLFAYMHGVIGIYLTNKCNMTCRHCSVSSGPNENTKIVLDNILLQIEHLSNEGRLRGIHVSGGEPFLYPRDLRTISDLASRLKLALAVATNASWATSEEKAKSILTRLGGVSQLLLSTDEYHAEFSPPERVITASKVCEQLGIRVTINVCAPHGVEAKDVPIYRYITSADLNQVDVVVSQVELGGRAAQMPEAYWRGTSAEYPTGACAQITRPVILEDQSVLACCNTTVAEHVKESSIRSAKLGHGATLAVALSGMRNDPVVQALRLFGPSFLANRLSHKAREKLKGKYIAGDICDLCRDMMSVPEVVQELRSMMSAPAMNALISSAQKVVQ